MSYNARRVTNFLFLTILMVTLYSSMVYADPLRVDTAKYRYIDGHLQKDCIGRCMFEFELCKETGAVPTYQHSFLDVYGNPQNQDDVVQDVQLQIYDPSSNPKWKDIIPQTLRAQYVQGPMGMCRNFRVLFSLTQGTHSIDYVPVYDRTYSEYAVFLNLNDQVAYYKMDVDLDPILEDAHNFSLNGSINGSGIIHTAGGLINSAYNLTGSGYMDLQDRQQWTFTDNATDNPFSIAMWFNPDTTAGVQGLFGKFLISGAKEYRLYRSSQKMQFYIYDETSVDRLGAISNDNVFMTNNWFHVVVTYDGSETYGGIKFYVNNESKSHFADGSGTYDGMADTTTPLWLGAFDPSTFLLDGVIDEVAIFNASLTHEQVSELWNQGAGFQYPFEINDSIEINETINETNASVVINVDTEIIADQLESFIYILLFIVLMGFSVVSRTPIFYIITGLFGIFIGLFIFQDGTTTGDMMALLLVFFSTVFTMSWMFIKRR